MQNTKSFSITTIGFAVLLLFILMPTVSAQNGNTYKVGTSSLSVRSTPAGNGEIIGQLSEGSTVIVFKKVHGWAMTYYGGKEAWVASQFLVPENATQTTQTKVDNHSTNNYIAVTANGVHLRNGPGTNHTVIGSASQGDTYRLSDTKGDWHQIVLSNGNTAWIAAWLTTPSSSNPTTKKTDSKTALQHTNKQQMRNSLAGYNIVIDAGHGGKDPGSIGFNGGKEKNLTLSTADKVRDILQNQGATVIMTRSNDQFVSLDRRVQISNGYRTSAFISLHYNAFPVVTVGGVSTHYYSGKDDMRLAQNIQSSLMQHVNMTNRGIRQSDYHVLRTNHDLAVLVELGFITNPYDAAKINSDQYQTDVANAIADGLKAYFH